MAGHSQFKNIMHRKGAQDAKRAKLFTKIIRELTVAAKEGGLDPDANPRLRTAIGTARSSNMPKDTMERAIKRGAVGDDDTIFEEIRYEGYGPGGVAIIVDGLTDNRNRTASEVRSAFNKHNGNLGETNSVSFGFDRLGQIRYPAKVASADEMFETAIEAGAEDVNSTDDSHEIMCPKESFAKTRDFLAQKFGDPESAALSWVPQNTIKVDADTARTLLKLIDALEDNDDIQTVSANYEMSDDVLKELTS